MKLAPEGRPFVLAGVAVLIGLCVLALVVNSTVWLAAALWTPIAAWLPIFFRDPLRIGPREPHLVLAPADGKVVSVGETKEPDYLHGAAVRVSVFMNVFNVHVNRHPVAGRVEYRDYRPGRFVSATLDKASQDNERMSLGVRSRRGPLLVRQIAGLVARRIVTDHSPGDEVDQGQRLGLIRFGSRVDTYLPPSARVIVRVGDRTVAGQTIIAEWQS